MSETFCNKNPCDWEKNYKHWASENTEQSKREETTKHALSKLLKYRNEKQNIWYTTTWATLSEEEKEKSDHWYAEWAREKDFAS